MRIIELNNIGRRFIKKEENISSFNKHDNIEFWALKNINMKVYKGEIIGLIGRNGSGKSTLLKVISGIIPPTEGDIKVQGKISSLLTLGAGFQEELSGEENIFLNSSLLGLKRDKIKEKLVDIVTFSELGDFIYEPLGSYSDGMKMRLGFSVAINIDFDILLIDEVIMVGDISFQKKCFNKLMKFRKQNKTMVVTTQSMDAIKRFCNRVVLLENGNIEFDGETYEGVDRYLKLLNQKKFMERKKRTNLVLDTKKWATDMDEWENKEGTQEVKITSVKIFDRLRRRTTEFKTGSRMLVEVNFEALAEVKKCIFGIAIFREDGVYCYGPNTKFDGYDFDELKKGNGFFRLEYKNILLMPGVYYLSVAIWDEEEKFPYDYHRCCYKIKILGDRGCDSQLLNLDCKWKPQKITCFFKKERLTNSVNINYLNDKWRQKLDSDVVEINNIDLLDSKGHISEEFFTNRYMEIKVNFKIKDELFNNNLILWIGIFRRDGIYCHGVIKKISSVGETASLVYPSLKLLPGDYRISLGFWDLNKSSFKLYQHGTISFKVIFNRKDHGTVYLDHKWRWRLPQEEGV